MKDLIIISNFTCKTDFVLIWKQSKIQNFQAKKKKNIIVIQVILAERF